MKLNLAFLRERKNIQYCYSSLQDKSSKSASKKNVRKSGTQPGQQKEGEKQQASNKEKEKVKTKTKKEYPPLVSL